MSPRRRANETLPQHSAGSEFEGRHQAERVLNSEVPYIRYLIGWIAKTFDYINRVNVTLPLSVYEGTWTHSPPLVAMHFLDRSCVIVGFFLKLLCSPTVASEPGLCVDVICMSGTQRVVGDNSHTAYQRLTLIRRYCWMKRPGPTLRVRLRETGSTDVLRTQVAGGCQFLQL